MKPQATKTTPAGVRLHLLRQEVFGPSMARNADRPRPIELLVVTGVALAALVIAAHRGWFSGWML